jgi:hypothetical protein
MSTYEGEHTIFGLFGQANLTQKKNEMLSFQAHFNQLSCWLKSRGLSQLLKRAAFLIHAFLQAVQRECL